MLHENEVTRKSLMVQEREGHEALIAVCVGVSAAQLIVLGIICICRLHITHQLAWDKIFIEPIIRTIIKKLLK